MPALATDLRLHRHVRLAAPLARYPAKDFAALPKAHVLNHLKYDSYGKVTAESNTAIDHIFAYTGRERDEETGLHYYRARYYDAATGRFTSEDPLSFSANDTHLTRYVSNNPVDYTDPLGLEAVGHHYAPVKVITELYVNGDISQEAVDVAMGYTSGGTDPPHCFGTYGGVTHQKYNDEIKAALKKAADYNKSKGLPPMTGPQMHTFIQNKILGAPARSKIAKFNNAVNAQVVSKTTAPTVKEALLKGQKYIKQNPRRFATIGLASVMTGFISQNSIDAVKGLESVSQSHAYKRAIEELQAGNLDKAQEYLLGSSINSYETQSIFDQIHNVRPNLASKFEKEMKNAIDKAVEEQRLMESRYDFNRSYH